MDDLQASSAASRCIPGHSNASHSAIERSVRIPLRAGLAVFASALLLSGCEPVNAGRDARARADGAALATAINGALRVLEDPARNRTWVLSVDDLAIYHTPTHQLIRRVRLPAWTVADCLCLPDIVVDGRGTAFVSHNIEPKLWEIHSDQFTLREHTLRLVGREHLDIGFSTLAVAATGTLIGAASTGGSVWRIDLREGTAYEVEHARADACA